jgi:hypothetical protein
MPRCARTTTVRPTEVRSAWAVGSTAVEAALWAPLRAGGTALEAGWLAGRIVVSTGRIVRHGGVTLLTYHPQKAEAGALRLTRLRSRIARPSRAESAGFPSARFLSVPASASVGEAARNNSCGWAYFCQPGCPLNLRDSPTHGYGLSAVVPSSQVEPGEVGYGCLERVSRALFHACL